MITLARVVRLGALVLVVAGFVIAEDLPKLPKTIPGTVYIPNLLQRPTKVVKPVFPAAELQKWAQQTVIFDVVVGAGGEVEMVGCDDVCHDVHADFIDAGVTAVRQWHWDPVMQKGHVVRVRTRVAVDFLLDETSPAVSVCTALSDPKWYNGRVMNLSGTVARERGLNEIGSKDCVGTMVIGMDGDATPSIKDAKYAQLEQGLAFGPTEATLRGLVRADNTPGHLDGQRLVLQRVLKVAAK
jgi:hypothetical protein